MRKKAKYPLDGAPLATGLACLLKQFNPAYTHRLLAYLGQYVRYHLHASFAFEGSGGSAVGEVPKEVLTVLLFMQQLCIVSGVPRSVLNSFVPPYIFDAIKIGVPGKK